MSTRLDTIKRLAESDPYWRGYLAGMEQAHENDAAARECARLMQARLDRANELRARREREQDTEYLTPNQARKYPGGTADL